MTKKIFKSIFAVAIAVLVASIIIIFGVLNDYFQMEQGEQLENELYLVSHGFENAGANYFENYDSDNCRITWIASDGTVLADTDTSVEDVDNHAEREEVKQALETGFGESVRYSQTLLEKVSYVAKLQPDGTVLRVSVKSYTAIPILLGLLQPMIVVLIIAVALASVLASRMSKRIVKPLNAIDLEEPLSNDVYDELAPMMRHIEHQRAQILKQLNEINRDKEELSAITDNLGEGLIVLNSGHLIVSINPAAKKIFGADDSCIGKDFIVIDREPEAASLIDEALVNGHGEIRIDRNGCVYRLSASRIGAPEDNAGAVVLVFDITEMVFAEKNRREFTANVSHELKTPLQSIMGSAELIEKGLVKKEDMPTFISRIRNESQRLLTLIEDIIHLSHMDENRKIAFEDIDLFDVVKEVCDELSENAAKRNITVTVQGESLHINAVSRLVYEIVFNLFDNAVKYNTDSGKIDVRVAKSKEGAIFEITDTGIGIPAEAQSHVFERFYRVDKSRSKAIGGTGLGLSIVKHAANYLKARIELKSQPGKGTQVKVIFR